MPRYTDIDKLIAEYDRVHVGPAGGARKLMVEAPIADVAPRAEVAREIFEKLERLITKECLVFKDENGIRGYVDASVHYAIAELKKKYTEGEK